MADFDIGSILSSLSAEDMENIKNIASSFMGEKSNDAQPQPQASQKTSKAPPMPDLSGLGMPDLSQLSALVPIMQAFNQPDERLEFINALKPLLSQEKRQKADEAMKLVRLVSVFPLLRERGIM